MATKFGYDSIVNFMNSQIPMGIFNGLMSLCAGFYGVIGGAIRVLYQLDLNKIKANKEQYPLEYAEKIIIDDSEGLEFLLSKTYYGELTEWGTARCLL